MTTPTNSSGGAGSGIPPQVPLPERLYLLERASWAYQAWFKCGASEIYHAEVRNKTFSVVGTILTMFLGYQFSKAGLTGAEAFVVKVGGVASITMFLVGLIGLIRSDAHRREEYSSFSRKALALSQRMRKAREVLVTASDETEAKAALGEFDSFDEELNNTKTKPSPSCKREGFQAMCRQFAGNAIRCDHCASDRSNKDFLGIWIHLPWRHCPDCGGTLPKG